MEVGSFGKILVSSITTTGSTLEFTAPVPLFDSLYNNGAVRGHTGNWNTFAVSRDGKRFLIPRPESPKGPVVPTPITVVLNWTAGLKK